MNTVIYDPEDLEPITVVDLPRQFFKALDEKKQSPFVRFSIYEPMVFSARISDITEEMPLLKVAEIRFERFIYREQQKWMAFAMNPEICLLLKSVFLPGQSKALNDERNKARARGILEGLKIAVKHFGDCDL